MKLQVISDGTTQGTKIQTETGEDIEFVTNLKWEVTADKPELATINFTVSDVRLKINSEYRVVKPLK